MASGVKYPNGDPVRWWRGKVSSIESASQEAMQEFADTGAEKMREFISTRGTGWVGRGARATPGGRIDTGKMIDAVKSSKVRASGAGRYTATFGWLGSQGRADSAYFLLQEAGFRHVGGGTVEGMYALRDAADHALLEFRGIFADKLRSVQ